MTRTRVAGVKPEPLTVTVNGPDTWPAINGFGTPVTLVSVGGSRTLAAKRLGISLRCLQYKLKFYSEQDQANGHANGAQDAPNHRSVPDLEPGMSL